jgi:hypothetical protein
MIIYRDCPELLVISEFFDFIADGYECKELEHFIKPKIQWWIVIYV